MRDQSSLFLGENHVDVVGKKVILNRLKIWVSPNEIFLCKRIENIIFKIYFYGYLL